MNKNILIQDIVHRSGVESSHVVDVINILKKSLYTEGKTDDFPIINIIDVNKALTGLSGRSRKRQNFNLDLKTFSELLLGAASAFFADSPPTKILTTIYAINVLVNTFNAFNVELNDSECFIIWVFHIYKINGTTIENVYSILEQEMLIHTDFCIDYSRFLDIVRKLIKLKIIKKENDCLFLIEEVRVRYI